MIDAGWIGTAAADEDRPGACVRGYARPGRRLRRRRWALRPRRIEDEYTRLRRLPVDEIDRLGLLHDIHFDYDRSEICASCPPAGGPSRTRSPAGVTSCDEAGVPRLHEMSAKRRPQLASSGTRRGPAHESVGPPLARPNPRRGDPCSTKSGRETDRPWLHADDLAQLGTRALLRPRCVRRRLPVERLPSGLGRQGAFES